MMPIISVRALPQKPAIDIQNALKKTCVEVAKVFACSSHQVWANYCEIPSGFYIEGENSADSQPKETHPPLVELIAFEGRDQEVIEKALETIAETLTNELQIPNNIFITYKEARSGQVFTGGSIRYKTEV